ncbi:hypothetical protein CRUP_027543 [Coryphaenoides rupestris]|nr:hypothetical protein CRUP_027543 [Coryphaenoides rupestris]
MFRTGGVLKLAAVLSAFFMAVFLAFELLDINKDFHLGRVFATTPPPRHKCGLSKTCPTGHFAFKMASGAASVVGPKICLEDNILMSGVKNNVGRGINVVLVNGETGVLIKTDFFDMWAGEVAPFIKFLKEIPDGTVVMMATFDDPATKKLISELGSSVATSLKFRDNWIFVGGKGIKTKTPFEQHIKNSGDTNKYEGWPEVLGDGGLHSPAAGLNFDPAVSLSLSPVRPCEHVV